ncbi:hypothetical protein Q6346_13500 [Isoptericola sp. b490]|uniref:hypothetical protein n=1 Tax=Actinotalea lenta TaxID=3064654 RepID=UPI002713DF82|nr:hypothetical protein [Isoptericola sp. b490]MDO8122325.1 hypothetical protein [Isoptericola sp. b490]
MSILAPNPLEDLAGAVRSGRLTVPVSLAAAAVNVSRQVLYKEIADDRFPGLRLGSARIVVPVGGLLQYLGFDPDVFIQRVLSEAAGPTVGLEAGATLDTQDGAR